MSAEDQWLLEAVAYFKAHARRAFARLCSQHGLVEQSECLGPDENPFRLEFASASIRVVIEGVNWGDNTGVSLVPNRQGASRYGVWELLSLRPPPVAIAGTQVEQLYGFASYLEGHAADALAGDTRVFELLDERAEKARREADSAQQAARRARLAQGYVEVASPFGAPILRRIRPTALDYHSLKQQFPLARDVTLAEVLPAPAEAGTSALITAWLKEVGSEVQQGEGLCDVGIEKGNVEMPSPVAGRILWLLPEGELVAPSSAVALILPQP